MKKINKISVITSIVCLLPIIIGIIFYKELPNEVAIHFDINDDPNSYISKPLFVFGVPVFMMLIQMLTFFLDNKNNKNPEANKKASTAFMWIIPIITIVMYIVTIMYALGSNLDMGKIAMVLLGIILIVVGNYVPKTKNNGMIHFGLKRELDEKKLKKISRISGYVLIIDGLISMFSILFSTMVSVVVVGIIFIQAIIISIYSLKD